MFSRRAGWEIRPNALSEALREAARQGRQILDLTESNPTRCGFSYLKRELLEPFRDPANLIYEPDPRGLKTAREAVCGYYAEKNIRLAPEQIFISSSTSEAYTFLFRLLCDPNDGILVPGVSYPLFEYLAGLNDLEIRRYPLTYRERWQIDLPELEAVEKKNAKALILVNPNNPTGHFVSPEERTAVNRLSRERGLAVLSDEVFLDYSYGKGEGGDNPSHSFAGNTEALTFTLSGISKALGLPQMKIAWIAVSGPERSRDEAVQRLEIIADTYLSAGTPAQRALPQWLKFRDAAAGEIRARVSANRGHLSQALKKEDRIKMLQAEGGWYAILQLVSNVPDETLALALLEEKGVLVQPGYFYDLAPGTFLVLSLLPKPEIFQKGIQCLIEKIKDL